MLAGLHETLDLPPNAMAEQASSGTLLSKYPFSGGVGFYPTSRMFIVRLLFPHCKAELSCFIRNMFCCFPRGAVISQLLKSLGSLETVFVEGCFNAFCELLLRIS